jgi:hypothetical protein
LSTTSFATQVAGFYRPERARDDVAYAWTNGDATLRLPWPAGTTTPFEVHLDLAAGLRPAHLGAARVCLSALPEAPLWPTAAGQPVDLGCHEIGDPPAPIMVRLDPAVLPPAPSGAILIHLDSPAWTPAAEDPAQTDLRSVGVQFRGATIAPAP